MFCSQCGQPVDEGKAFCKNCGARIGGAQPPPEEAPTQIRPSPADVPTAPPSAPPSVVPPSPPPPQPSATWDRQPTQVHPGAPRSGWEQPPQPARGRTRLILGIIAVIVILGGGGAGAYFAVSGGGDDGTATTVAASSTTSEMPSSTTVLESTTTLPPPTESTTTTTTGLGDVEAYLVAMVDLENLLGNCDGRIPQLADRINATNPSIPRWVYDELAAMFSDVETARQELNRHEPTPAYVEADGWLQDAVISMEARIESTMEGIHAIWDSGNVNAGNRHFDDGRKARNEFRNEFQKYLDSLPGE